MAETKNFLDYHGLSIYKDESDKQISKKVDIEQGIDKAGKALVVDVDGNVTTDDIKGVKSITKAEYETLDDKTGSYVVIDEDYDILSGEIGYKDTTVENALDELNISLKGVTQTLVTGETSLTFTDESISTDSTVDIYSTLYGLCAKDVSVTNGSITLTFDAQTEDIDVKVRWF